MRTRKPSKDNDSGGQASLGSALGPDPEPVGKRILIPKGRDAKPLKIKLPTKSKDSER